MASSLELVSERRNQILVGLVQFVGWVVVSSAHGTALSVLFPASYMAKWYVFSMLAYAVPISCLVARRLGNYKLVETISGAECQTKIAGDRYSILSTAIGLSDITSKMSNKLSDSFWSSYSVGLVGTGVGLVFSVLSLGRAVYALEVGILPVREVELACIILNSILSLFLMGFSIKVLKCRLSNSKGEATIYVLAKSYRLSDIESISISRDAILGAERYNVKIGRVSIALYDIGCAPLELMFFLLKRRRFI